MKPGANIPNGFVHRRASHLPLLDLTGAAVNDFLPFRFSIRIHGVVQAGDQFMGKVGTGFFRQSQHLGHFFSNSAHARRISLTPAD
jgi:hypothetical protein